ncbi:MAG: TraR/DksA C4-type zinc finger protein [Tepidisphaeraceae bacterium]
MAKPIRKKAAVKKSESSNGKPKAKTAPVAVKSAPVAVKNAPGAVKVAPAATKSAPMKEATIAVKSAPLVKAIKIPPKPVLVEKRPAPPKPAPDVPQFVQQMPAVPTDGKPRKNQAGISPKELQLYRDLILAKRREIVGDMSSMEREALRSSSGSNLSNLPIHMADMGTDNYEQEFTLGLMEKDRKLLRDLNDALAKIQNGSYGICEGTGKPISKARLEAQPWARFSIEYARKLERRLR